MPNITDFFNPTPKQRQVLKYIGKGYNIFYGGAKGGGKTDLAIFVCVLSCLQFKNLKAAIIRETYPELESEIIDRVFKTYPEKVFGYRYNERKKVVYFKNGSQIHFRSIGHPKDFKKIQGIEYQLIVIDEAPNFDVDLINKIQTSLRGSRNKDFIPTLLMTGNPLGRSDYYFQTRFVEPDESVWSDYEREIKDKMIFIPANVFDNPYVGEEYVQRLKSLPKYLQEAYLEGKWGVGEGQFFEKFNPAVHVIEPFEIPQHWTRKAGLDIGWSNKHPTVCLWVAQNPDTQELFVYREYVGVGSTTQYAFMIKELEKDDGFVQTWADPSMFYKSKPQESLAESEAFIFLRMDKPIFPAVNDRVLGWRIVKQWLDWDDEHPPKLKIFNTCQYLIRTLPQQKYSLIGGKKEDLDTNGPDDAVDALRYVLVSGFTYPVDDLLPTQEIEQKEEDYSDLFNAFRREEDDEKELDIYYDKALY